MEQLSCMARVQSMRHSLQQVLLAWINWTAGRRRREDYPSNEQILTKAASHATCMAPYLCEMRPGSLWSAAMWKTMAQAAYVVSSMLVLAIRNTELPKAWWAIYFRYHACSEMSTKDIKYEFAPFTALVLTYSFCSPYPKVRSDLL